jgi:integrase
VKQVEHAGTGQHSDGGGLYLQVKGNARSWIYRFTFGKERWMGLGSYPTISLARARELADDARRLRAEGINPIEHREAQRAAAKVEAAKAVTFDQAVERYIAAHEAAWKNAKHRQQWRNTLATYASPIIGSLPVGSVNTELVMRVLEPIWTTKTETASRLRGRIEVVLDWAKVNGYRDGENPARWTGHLDQLLPKRSKVRKVKHHPAMPYKDVPVFMDALSGRKSVSARALEFTILTAARTNETIGARWTEIDIGGAMWTIPAPRMKAEKEHKVPLSPHALTILAKLPRKGEYVFQQKGRPLSNMAMLEMLALAGHADLTVHGFRSSFKDWATDWTPEPAEIVEAAKRGEIVEAFPRDLVEVALAHTLDNKTEEAYRHTKMIEKRRRLMMAWANYCASKTSAVAGDVHALHANKIA